MTRPKNIEIIAEIGVNHNGSVELAKELIIASKNCGATSVKFQTYVTEKLVSPNASKARYQEENIQQFSSQFEMLKSYELSKEDYKEIKLFCIKNDIRFLSTPFDEESADFLFDLGIDAYKVSSGDLTNIPFLQYLAKKSIPMIISTGMADLEEVDEAVKAILETKAINLSILHCVSSYPAKFTDCNLLAIKTMRDRFKKTIGWSDHTNNNNSAIIALALGAEVFEKHITLDKKLEGPDHCASSTPNEFKSYVEDINNAAKALGDGRKIIKPSEIDTKLHARKSIHAIKKIPKGTLFTKENIAVIRPNDGPHPRHYRSLIGKTSSKDYSEFEALNIDLEA